MNSVAFVVIVAFVAFAAGANNSTLKVISTMKSTRNIDDDMAIVDSFVTSCGPALAIFESCTLENNYNPTPDPTDLVEICRMSRIEAMCAERGILAGGTCAGQQDALAAVRRVIPWVETFCAAVGGSATPAVMGFFTLIILTCVTLLH